MDNKMSYRSPKSTKFPGPPHLPDYDADDEDTLEFDIENFTLPDGTLALDPAALKRIEEATKMMKDFEIENSMRVTLSEEEDGGAENTDSNKENEAPFSAYVAIDMEGQEESARLKVDVEVEEPGDGPDTDGYSAPGGQAPSEADSIEALYNSPRQGRRSPAEKMDEEMSATSLKEANTQIWLLKGVIKDLQYDIKQLKIVNARQAGVIQSLGRSTRGKEMYEDIFGGGGLPSGQKTSSSSASDGLSGERDGSGEKKENETTHKGTWYQPPHSSGLRGEKRKGDSSEEMMDVDRDRSKRVKKTGTEFIPPFSAKTSHRRRTTRAPRTNPSAFKAMTPTNEDIARGFHKEAEEETVKLRDTLYSGDDTTSGVEQNTPNSDKSADLSAWMPTGDLEDNLKALGRFRAEHARLLANKERRQQSGLDGPFEKEVEDMVEEMFGDLDNRTFKGVGSGIHSSV